MRMRLANEARPADFLRDNLQIQTNVIDAAWHHGVRYVAGRHMISININWYRTSCQHGGRLRGPPTAVPEVHGEAPDDEVLQSQQRAPWREQAPVPPLVAA